MPWQCIMVHLWPTVESCAWTMSETKKKRLGERRIWVEGLWLGGPLLFYEHFQQGVAPLTRRSCEVFVNYCHSDNEIVHILPSFFTLLQMVFPWLWKAALSLGGVERTSHTCEPVCRTWKKQGRTMFEKKVRLCFFFFFFFFTCLEEVNSSVWISRVGTGCGVERCRRDSLPLRSHCGRHGTGLWDSDDFCGSRRTLLHERIYSQWLRVDIEQKDTQKFYSETVISAYLLGININSQQTNVYSDTIKRIRRFWVSICMEVMEELRVCCARSCEHEFSVGVGGGGRVVE